MKRVNVNIYPKDGYFFQEEDGTIIRANNGWKAVIIRVMAYRKRNKKPLGDPTKEVHAQACARDPQSCHDDEDPVRTKQLKISSLKGKVLGWLASLRGKPQNFVDEGLMRARAQVCAGCPMHTAIAGGCGACKKAVNEARREVIGNRPVDERMAGCLVLGEDTGVNTWLSEPTVGNPELPACCWRRNS
jgi:hypothetical protein